MNLSKKTLSDLINDLIKAHLSTSNTSINDINLISSEIDDRVSEILSNIEKIDRATDLCPGKWERSY